MVKILVVDAERSVRNTLKEMLEYEGYRVDTAQGYDDGVEMARTIPFDVVVCEITCRYSPAGESLNGDIPIIIISRDTNTAVAVEAIKTGAVDYITKPIDINRLFSSIKSAINYDRRGSHVQKAETPDLRPRNKNYNNIEEIVGVSPAITHVKHLIDKVAPSEARVLITGSNGTGKELVARWLHEKSLRGTGPFVEVNCAAIPSELIESELFGHEKGAFTSAVKQRKGKFELAHCGTLFMDEIGDMSLAAQAKVLRVLQEHRISRVGGDRDIEVNVRVVAATNKDLLDEIRHGRFREDLYHRLSVIVIRVPNLNERVEDIPLLVDHLIRKTCLEYGIPKKEIEEQALEEFKSMEWRGNVRELGNVVERLIILSGNVITLEDVRTYVLGVV